jgi:cupin fold WbuC family metalloprotein
MLRYIDPTLLDAVSAEAKASPRRRKNRNFHSDDAEPGHRLLNAIEPDSYIMPHRHLDPNKGETMVVLRGALGLVIFDDSGKIIEATQLSDGPASRMGVDIPSATWHSVFALTPDTVFLEAKAGPYQPLSPDEKAPWAPAEGTPQAAAYLDDLRREFSSVSLSL